MNNRQVIKNALLSDLSGDGPGRVACLSGTWGCGKTHLWRELEADLQRQGKRTAYVSLFGLTSVVEAKSAVVNEVFLGQSLLDKMGIAKLGSFVVKQVPNLLRFADSKIGFELLTKNLDLTRMIPHASVVCLDDLERISEHFRVEDALGFANLLAEQRGCRVLLIMNNDHLSERLPETASRIRAYRERVVRRFLTIETDLREVLPFIVSSYSIPLPAPIASVVVDTLIRAKCSNIRTLVRALQNVTQLSLALSGSVEPSDAQLATALTSEDAVDAVADEAFYSFHPVVFAVDRHFRAHPRSGRTDPTDPRRDAQERFYRQILR